MQKYPNYINKLKKRKEKTSKNSSKINMIDTKTLSPLPLPHLKKLSHDLSIINENNINLPIPFNDSYPDTLNCNDTCKYFDTSLNFNNTFTYFDNYLSFNIFTYFDTLNLQNDLQTHFSIDWMIYPRDSVVHINSQ